MADHAVLTAREAEDCITDQDWGRYTAEDHAVWRALFDRQFGVLRDHAAPEFLDGLATLGIDASGVPEFSRMNARLRAATGWEVVAVPGLIPSRPFFQMLASRRFPAGTFIRTREQLDYLEEPDVFHDVFGHVPLLSNAPYADYMAEYGRIGLEAVERKGVKFLARLNWYTIEFGLIRRAEGVKIYGAGICSSWGEARYVVGDPSAHWLGFDLERVLRTGYYIDDFQASYFVIDRFGDLFALTEGRDWPAVYDRMREAEPLTPFAIEPGDEVIRRGTGAYWCGFPEAKGTLK